MNTNTQSLVTTSELCEILKTTRQNIHRQKKLGMPHYRLGLYPRFDVEEVKEWMRNFPQKPSFNEVKAKK